MRLPSALAVAGLFLACAALVPKAFYDQCAETDVGAIADKVQTLVRNADAAFEQDEKALKEARAGWACLGGTGPCPGGGRSPFGR